jgi:hypothetical protein
MLLSEVGRYAREDQRKKGDTSQHVHLEGRFCPNHLSTDECSCQAALQVCCLLSYQYNAVVKLSEFVVMDLICITAKSSITTSQTTSIMHSFAFGSPRCPIKSIPHPSWLQPRLSAFPTHYHSVSQSLIFASLRGQVQPSGVELESKPTVVDVGSWLLPPFLIWESRRCVCR